MTEMLWCCKLVPNPSSAWTNPFLASRLTTSISANNRWLIDCLCLFVFTQSPTASPGCQTLLVSHAESSQQQTLTWLWHLEQSTNVKPSWQLLFLRQCARRGGIYRSEITIYLPSILSLLSQAVHFTKKVFILYFCNEFHSLNAVHCLKIFLLDVYRYLLKIVL